MTQHFTTHPRSLDSRPDYSAPEAETVNLTTVNIICSSIQDVDVAEEFDIFE